MKTATQNKRQTHFPSSLFSLLCDEHRYTRGEFSHGMFCLPRSTFI